MVRKSSDDCKESSIDDEEYSQIWIEYQEHQEDTQLVNPDEPFKLNCNYCSEKFLTVEKRFLHERICTTGRTRRFSCKVCRINFHLKQGLQRHEKRHKKPGGFSCWTCDAKFTSLTDRKQHRDAEHRVYRCQICEAKFRSPSDYVGHIVEIHGNEKKVKDEFGIGMAQGELEQLMEGNEISITHEIHVFEEQEDKKEGSEELLNVIFLNGKDPKTERTKLEDREEIPNQNISQVDRKSEVASSKETKQNTEDLNDDDFSDNFIDVGISHFDDSDDSKPETKTEEENKEAMKHDAEYRCKFCPQVYYYEELYLLHLKTHDAEKTKESNREKNSDKLPCKYCEKQYHPKSLKRHMDLHATDGKLKLLCYVCKSHFDTRLELKKHKEVQHTKKLTCHYCSKIFFQKTRLQHHIELLHKKIYPCGKCDKRFKGKITLQDHERSDCGKSPSYQCDVCKKFYRTAGSLKSHSAIHRKGSPFLCKYCGEAFEMHTDMKQHERVHTGEKKITTDKVACKYCKKQYRRSSLKLHMSRHTPDGKLKISCAVCHNLFNTKSELKEHKEIQHTERYTCHYCSKSYIHKPTLKMHIEMLHTKTKIREKCYLCGKCGKRFQNKTILHDHERSDCGRSPIYQCDVCKKFLHSAGSLKTHSVIHTSERPFVCKYCGKGFKFRDKVKVHERVHTGEKPFKCTYCPMAFSHYQNRVNHINMHLGIKRYMCSGCGQRFSCISGLQSHRKAHADTCGLVPNCTKPVGPGQSFSHEI